MKKSVFGELLKADVSYLAQITLLNKNIEIYHCQLVGDLRPLFQGHIFR